MKGISQPIKACTDVWIACENLLINLAQKETSFSIRTKQVIDECASICLGAVSILKTTWNTLSFNQFALLCVGICEECAEVCARYKDAAFKSCADSCRRCSAIFSSYAQAAL